jgi:tetratricopeptide (TPR) repeat protein
VAFQKLKYSPKRMNPSKADRKSGKRIYLNRCLLMEEVSGCVYLEYVREDRPEGLYPFLFRAFAAKEPDQKLLSGMPDVLVLPKSLQHEELISLLRACSVEAETPPPGFRSGSSVFREINLMEENFEDDGLWIAPSTYWTLDLEYVSRQMAAWVSATLNALPKADQRLSRMEIFRQNHPSLPYPGDKDAFLSALSPQTRHDVQSLESERGAAKPKAGKKAASAKDWRRAEETFDLGREYAWSGNPKKAVQMYRRALEIYPGHVDAHGHIGHVLAVNSRFQEAEESYRRAVALGREQLGEIDPDEAWVDLDSRPFMRALHGLGLVLEEQRAWQGALECYQELLRIDPNDHLGIRYLIGHVYHELGDFSQARKCYEIASDWPEGAWNLVWLNLEEGDESAAALAAVRALQANAFVPNVLLRQKYIPFAQVRHCALHSIEQAIAYCREHLLMLSRVPNRREFLSAFCSVPEIRGMLDTDQPPDLSEWEAERLAAKVVERLG